MNSGNKEAFVARFGAVYEHSPWVAEKVFDEYTNTSALGADVLADQFKTVFMNASQEQQLAVLRAHPALACAQAEQKLLTSDSRTEQTGAGLDQCSEREFMMFQEMNAMYFGKNGFPFIIAVKGRNRQEILVAFRNRLNNVYATEFQTALKQVCQIGRFRIGDILDD